MRLVAALSLFVCTQLAYAELVLRNGADVIVLFENQSCKISAISDEAVRNGVTDLKAGESILELKKFKMCWIERGGWVFMFYEDGDVGRWEKKDFRKETPA